MANSTIHITSQISSNMKIKHIILLGLASLALATGFTSCGDKKKKSYDELATSGLTTRTENLKTNLKTFARRGTLVGQIYGTLEGIGWQSWTSDSSKCDMQSVCGYHPAVNGYELAGIESGKQQNADGIPFNAIREDVLKNFRKGALLTMNWTMPGYSNEAVLEEYAKQVGKYLDTLQDAYGIKAPIVLNLLPIDGKAWYCKLGNEEYIQLYKKLQELLKDNDVTNVLYAYSETYQPGGNLMERYPDNDIDVINVTYLQTKDNTDIPAYAQSIKTIISKALPFAQDHNNAFGLTTGIEAIGDSSIFSQILIPELNQHPIAYLMFGGNHGEPVNGHYFVPYPGVENKKTHGFMQLVNNETSIFLEKLNGLYLKQK